MTFNEELIIKVGQLLKVASDPTRLKIMFCLLDDSKCHCQCRANGECSKCQCLSCMIEKNVNEIALEIGASQSLVSHQLKTLRENDFVKTRKESTTVFYSLKDGHIKELLELAKEHVLEGDK